MNGDLPEKDLCQARLSAEKKVSNFQQDKENHKKFLDDCQTNLNSIGSRSYNIKPNTLDYNNHPIRSIYSQYDHQNVSFLFLLFQFNIKLLSIVKFYLML